MTARRSRSIAAPVLLGLLLALAFPHAAQAAAKGQEPRIFLSVEPLLVDGSRIQPLTSPSNELIPVDRWGAHHQIVKLNGASDRSLRYKLEFEVVAPNALKLTLERFLHRGADEERALPKVTHRLDVLDSWRTTLLERSAGQGRIDLRVTPVIRGAIDDAPFHERTMKMHFRGGPMLVYGKNRTDDRVVHREVNVGGTRGLRVGVPGVGKIRLSVDPFDGARECGWIRGHRLYGELGGTGFSIFSTVQILPDDPLRPGKGWKVYGVLEPDPSMGYMDGFYGSFEP